MALRLARRSRLRRFLIWVGAPVLIIALIVLIALSFFVPGGVSQLELSYRPVPRAARATVPAAAPARVESGAPAAAPSAPTASVEKALFLTYTVPDALLQSEVAALFPITEGVESMLKIVLSDPRLVPDPDPAFLRLQLNIRVVMNDGSGDTYPGTAVMRTQIGFDGATKTVALRNAQLAEFRFTGAAAGPAEALRPVIASELPSQWNGYVVFQMPENPGWWLRNGASLVQDVVIENRQVVVVIGR